PAGQSAPRVQRGVQGVVRAARSFPSPRETGRGCRAKRGGGGAVPMRGPDRLKVGIGRRLGGGPTDGGSKRWVWLRDRRWSGFKFVRQEAIGPFIVDFVCRERSLIVEVDGGQHAENPRDARRDEYLGGEGYRVLRFWNNDVLANREGVLLTILDALQQ